MRLIVPRRAAAVAAAALLHARLQTTALAAPSGAQTIATFQTERLVDRFGPKLGGPFRKLTSTDAEGLEVASRYAPGEVLSPSGVRVVDIMQGKGPVPAEGTPIWLHFKVWTGGWDIGSPIDATYFNTRPIRYVRGSPSGRVLAGIDIGIAGMREGGWRRLVVPPAMGYGDAGWSPPTRSRRGIGPGEVLYVDVHLMDAGSGRCEDILSVSDRMKSISCTRGAP